MESLLNKYNPSIQSRIRSGHNKENQAPTGGNLRAFKNHSSTGPIGIPFKAKNSNSLHFHNGMNNLLRNQTNHHYEKLNFNHPHQPHKSLNNGLSLNINGPNNNGYIRKPQTNASCSSDEGVQSLASSSNSLLAIAKSTNQSALSTSTNSSSSQNKLNDLYKSQLSGSSSSLQSYSSSDASRDDKRLLPPPPKQNIMYHEQRCVTASRFETLIRLLSTQTDSRPED